MALIHMTREHSLSIPVLKQKIDNIAADLASEYQLKSEWEDNCLFFRRKGASGSIEVDAQSLELNLTLGTLFKVAKSEIESKINKMLDTHLNE
ncbi:polyhydroxyalkanoic acid system family protein [Psychromonas sp. SP041]|uniref:polyhydroxyalkanoic acid system family protein n=1 Tax=Psychromonas sp. SP041 TaxID=1365007 RepID=UPI0003F639D7|nr:polyhydroxyalkanoic acid system family protein [Psychromonas sp. SP041]